MLLLLFVIKRAIHLGVYFELNILTAYRVSSVLFSPPSAYWVMVNIAHQIRISFAPSQVCMCAGFASIFVHYAN